MSSNGFNTRCIDGHLIWLLSRSTNTLSHLMRLWYFLPRKLILQTCMISHPVGLDVWFFVVPFVYFLTSYVWTAKAVARLRKDHNLMSCLISYCYKYILFCLIFMLEHCCLSRLSVHESQWTFSILFFLFCDSVRTCIGHCHINLIFDTNVHKSPIIILQFNLSFKLLK